MTFTSRQEQIVRLIAAGNTHVQIADHFGIVPRTAKAHCDALRHKLGVTHTSDIPAAYLQETGNNPHPQNVVLKRFCTGCHALLFWTTSSADPQRDSERVCVQCGTLNPAGE